MKYALLAEDTGARMFALVLGIGDDVLDVLEQFCIAEDVLCASLSGIGGLRRATVGYYDMGEKRYVPIEIDDQVELLSFLGNVTQYRGKPKIHAHCVVGRRDGTAAGGHLLSATVRPTLELFVQEVRVPLRRSDCPDVGIPLIDL